MRELSERTIGDWLEFWAAETPDRECLIYSDRDLRYTWRQFNERVDRLAKGLLSIGVKKDDKVGVWATNVPDWVTYLYATAKIGAILVTVNTNYKQRELEFLCENSDMHTLCLTEGTRENDFIDMVYKMLPELKQCERGHINSEKFPCLKNVVYMGSWKFRGMYNTGELLADGEKVSDEAWKDAKGKVSCYDVINMQYTSGTTGFPKGVMLTHYGITNNGYFIGEGMGFTQNDKLCVCVPMFHCFGIVLGAINCLVHGCAMVMVEEFNPLVVLASIHKERCTVLYGVPTMYIAEMHHPMFDMFDMTSLRTGVMAGCVCPIDLMEEVSRKMHMTITTVYGLTESSPGMTQTTVNDDTETRYTTVGRNLPYIEVKVLDPKTGEECPDGVEGEMCTRGFNVMKGYYKDPVGTAEAIDKNGYLHSGDLGTKDPRTGCYKITGRIKDMIIRGGENIYPTEIEAFLRTMPGIKDVYVAAVPSKRYGEAVGAFIKLHDGVQMEMDDVRDFCKGQISRFKIPKYIFFMDEFPMTGSGKVQKFRLTEMSLDLCKKAGIEVI